MNPVRILTVFVGIEIHIVVVVVHGDVFAGIERCEVDAETVGDGSVEDVGGDSRCTCSNHSYQINITLSINIAHPTISII